MRRTVVVVVTLAAAVVAAAVSNPPQWGGQPRAAPVTIERLTATVFGDRTDSECIAERFERAGLSLDALGPLLGERSVVVNRRDNEEIRSILGDCLQNSPPSDVRDVMTLDDADDTGMIRFDPSIPLAASNRD